MKTAIDTALKLLNVGTHEAVETNAQGKLCVPVSVVRCLAHEILIVLRDYEAKHNELDILIGKAGEVLESLGKPQSPAKE